MDKIKLITFLEFLEDNFTIRKDSYWFDKNNNIVTKDSIVTKYLKTKVE